MEILLIACMLAYAAGSQSEQSKLGLSPAQRATMREQARHEKAVQKIADKHGIKSSGSSKAGISPWKEAPDAIEGSAPATFLSGYREARPQRPPLGHRAGSQAGTAVTWAQGAGRGAWRAYRERRRKAGHDDPGPVLVPLPPAQPPQVPPIPDRPPAIGKVADAAKPAEPKAADAAEPDSAAEPKPSPEAKPEKAEPAPLTVEAKPADATPEPEAGDTKAADTAKPTETTTSPGGVGRMAAEVTYGSVLDESDELSLMCDDDVVVYDRIRTRGEREVGRAEELIAAATLAGVGERVIGWIARCKEQYLLINQGLDQLEQNTIAQGEAVVKAKTLLLGGQGMYAGIAQDMESVADRQYYTGDAVDAEDTSAHSETYETTGA